MSDPLEIDITGTMETVSENAKSVLDNDETVTVSTEIVNESAPAVIELEPKTTSLVQEFDWNFAEIKQAIQQRIEKYVGLVVTEDNLKDMEDTQKEIAGLRAKIDAFRKQVKKQLNEPYDKFEGQVKELLAIVEQAEGPLRKQILQYEEDRRKAKETELLEFGRKTAANLGVRDEYFNLVIPAKWTNRTAKDGAVRKEIVTEVDPEPESEYSPEYLPPRRGDPPLPPFYPAVATALWDVQILLTGKSVTVQQAARVRQCMEQNGFTYEVISQERVK